MRGEVQLEVRRLRARQHTSKAGVAEVDAPDGESVTVQPSTAAKCGRCWHYRDDVGRDAAHPELCGRCVSNLHGDGEPRASA